MKLKKLNPTSPGTRHQIQLVKSNLSKKSLITKENLYIIKNKAGRSSQTGHTTVWHKGGCKKKKIKVININKNLNVFLVLAVFYDSKRNSFIALKFSLLNFNFSYCLYTNFVSIGTLLENKNNDNFVKPGFFLKIKYIPAGTLINSLTLKNKTVYARSAGSFCQLLQKINNFCKIKLPSGLILNLNSEIYATMGSVYNNDFKLKVLGKAGKNKALNKRPTVRGVAMNPVDHPHGGRTNGGRPSVTPWGKLTKGVPTVKKKKYV